MRESAEELSARRPDADPVCDARTAQGFEERTIG